MTGTEKILRHIAEQAEAESGKILEAARGEAAALTGAAEKEAAQITEAAEAKAEALRKEAETRLEASLAMQKRRAALSVKGEIVNSVLKQAYEDLKALPAEEYFAFLLKQLEHQVRAADGVIQVNEKDLARLPADFEEQAAAMAKAKGGSLKLAKEPAKIDGGFLLNYGGVVENGSFEAIFEARADEFKDAVCAVLFD
ncbi:MAG: V-type ATP synthase subunit E [Lachnospiraceae bacterium]|nr:V-type ATP synthase subunit E [Lachnospiraceae bacterium]